MPLLGSDHLTRFLSRRVVRWSSRGHVEIVSGLEHVAPEKDPFIAVANHSQRPEAILVPTLLLYHRRGKRVHFLADWPMMLVPGIGMLYRLAQVIPVFGKSARPSWLNALKPLYRQPGTAWERAGQKLQDGASVGVFPEGTINRHPTRLLRGRTGAARLAIECGVPVVPIGVRFPRHDGRSQIEDGEAMTLEIGAPLVPPDFAEDGRAPRELVRTFQVRIMEQLARLSGKSWEAGAPRRRSDGP